MKLLLLLAASLAAGYFTDLDAESALYCLAAPLTLGLCLCLAAAELLQGLGCALCDGDDPGDGGGAD